MSNTKKNNIKTKLTHLGRHPESHHGFINPPLYRGSTVLFETVEDLLANKGPFTYGRKTSPVFSNLEQAMNGLEGADRSFFTPSGLSAVTCSLSALTRPGDHILIADSVYFPTRLFCDKELAKQGVEVEYYDPMIGDGIQAKIKDNTRLLYMESPGSVTFEVQDLKSLIQAAKDHNLYTLIDNTWATPLYLNPIKMGIDISIHSGTKYFIGHSDGLLGVICCNKKTSPLVQDIIYHYGICASPEDCTIALRGLRTLATRLETHQKNALDMANWLRGQKGIKQVFHPALEDHPGHKFFKRDFKGSTGLFSVLLKGKTKAALSTFFNELELYGMGWSWGGYESLCVPVYPGSYRTVAKWDDENQLIRIHIGLEDLDDLKEDLSKALARWNAAV